MFSFEAANKISLPLFLTSVAGAARLLPSGISNYSPLFGNNLGVTASDIYYSSMILFSGGLGAYYFNLGEEAVSPATTKSSFFIFPRFIGLRSAFIFSPGVSTDLRVAS